MCNISFRLNIVDILENPENGKWTKNNVFYIYDVQKTSSIKSFKRSLNKYGFKYRKKQQGLLIKHDYYNKFNYREILQRRAYTSVTILPPPPPPPPPRPLFTQDEIEIIDKLLNQPLEPINLELEHDPDDLLADLDYVLSDYKFNNSTLELFD